MKVKLIKEENRGFADRGWLKAKHTFSFSSFYNAEQMHFGLLRVFNDDIVAPGMGFGTHPHDNMEIVTIPLKGKLKHRDSMGNESIIQKGEVQIMSAGTGLTHSEFNPDPQEELNLLQIWVYPKVRNIQPRYAQDFFESHERIDALQTVVSPDNSGKALWINQDAWFNLGTLSSGKQVTYNLRKSSDNGVWVFVIDGEVQIHDIILNKRDSGGFTETESLTISAKKNSEFVLIEVPMN